MIGDQVAADHFLRCCDRGGAGIGQTAIAVAASRARHHGAGAEQHGDDHLGLRLRHLLAHLGEMAAGQMAGFVRQHPDQLVRGLRLHDRAVIHENAVAVGDESVERAVVDDHDLDVLLFQARGAQDRPRIVAQQLLGFGVADHARRALSCCASAADIGAKRERRRGRDRGQFRGFLAWREAEQHGRSLSDWRRAGYGICPTKPWNAASLGHGLN